MRNFIQDRCNDFPICWNFGKIVNKYLPTFILSTSYLQGILHIKYDFIVFHFQATLIPWAPGTIFTIMSFVVAITTLYIPETRGIDFPRTLGEVKIWYAENSGF